MTEGTEPALRQLLLKLHKGATAGFNAKTTQLVLGLFDGWSMTKQDFIKPSDEIGWNSTGFRKLTAIHTEVWSEAFQRYMPHRNELSTQSRIGDNQTRLHVTSFSAEDAAALHAKVAEYVVAELPVPTKAKADDYFVMNLTTPVQSDDHHWTWSFDLFRKCKGYRITTPDGQHFDVCGPTKVLGFGGVREFGHFFQWALAETDLEAQINHTLGMSKHLKASERPRVPIGDQVIGTCAICSNQQVVRNGKMVLHGYQRPGYGYIVGDCFGVGYDPIETSAEACIAYLPVLDGHKTRTETYLGKLEAGEIVEFSESHRNYRTGQTEKTVIRQGDAKFTAKLRAVIRETKDQITKIKADMVEIQRRIDAWKPGKLRCRKVEA